MKSVIVQRRIDVNGVRLAYLEAGEGPLVVLLHGFPDDAWTWGEQIHALADAGYRVVAPFLRGYPPSEVPETECNSKNNAGDLTALLRALTDEPACVVGHDWGGLATFGTIAVEPGLVRRAAVEAVSHPATLLSILERPPLVRHLFHVWFFQIEELSEAAFPADDFALIDYLWDNWTRPGHDDAAHVARLKREVFAQPGVTAAVAGYYRALVRFPKGDPAFVADLLRRTTVPVLSIWGRDDPARDSVRGEREFFEGEYVHQVIDDARHFVHREQPSQFNDILLSWLAADSGTQSSAGDRHLRAAAPGV